MRSSEMDRRKFLQASGALAGLGLLGGCTKHVAAPSQATAPASGIPALPFYDAPGTIVPIRADMDRIFRITVCLRPFRAAGPRFDVEKVGDKTVVHNYGHGGSGWSLSWGSADVVVRKALEAVPGVRVVAVIGCGGIGLGAIAAAAFRGAATIAVDRDDRKLETARLAGASYLVNTAREDLHVRLAEITEGRGPDVIIEAIGLPQTFRAAVEAVAFAGRVVYIGYAKEQVCYESRLFVQKELDILGSRNALDEDFVSVIRMLEAGRFPVNEAVSAVVSLAEAPAMLAAWSASPDQYTKIIVDLER